MVEQEAVNFEVAGSNPASRAMKKRSGFILVVFSFLRPAPNWQQSDEVDRSCWFDYRRLSQKFTSRKLEDITIRPPEPSRTR